MTQGPELDCAALALMLIAMQSNSKINSSIYMYYCLGSMVAWQLTFKNSRFDWLVGGSSIHMDGTAW